MGNLSTYLPATSHYIQCILLLSLNTHFWEVCKSPSSQLEALFLTMKKLNISPQSNPCFLSTITRELFLLTSLAARFLSCLLKSLFILVLDTNLSDLYSATAWKESLVLSAIFISFHHFQIRCLPSSNFFWFPLNFSCTTSLSSLLLCSICFPLPSK